MVTEQLKMTRYLAETEKTDCEAASAAFFEVFLFMKMRTATRMMKMISKAAKKTQVKAWYTMQSREPGF